MLKIFLFVFIFTILYNANSQEVLSVFKNDLDDSRYTVKEVLPIVNQINDDFSLFFLNSKEVHAYLFSEDFEMLSSLSLEDKRRKYNTVIGYGINNNREYNVFLTNNNNNKFAGINFSFDGKTSDIQEFTLENSNEKFVQTVTVNNVFYLLSVTIGTSDLNIYKFEDHNLPKPNKITFKNGEFIDRSDQSAYLYDIFHVSSNGKFVGVETNKIDRNLPTSIEIAAKEKKLYVKNSNLIFTFDNNRNVTQILTLHLDDYSYDVQRIEKPLIEEKTSKKKSNSFINDNELYMIASTNDDMIVQIKNFNSKDILKEIKLNVEDSIQFKNTPIIQEGGVYDNYRELESTKKFLRKITAGDIGISSYKNKTHYLLTIGSEKEIPKGGGMMMPMGGFGGIPIASVGNANIFFNPTYFAYNSYSGTKSVHIKSMFDFDFKHIRGEVEENVFDRINKYDGSTIETENSNKLPSNKSGYRTLQEEAKKNSNTIGETIFKYKDFLVLGNYNAKEKLYELTKFED